MPRKISQPVQRSEFMRQSDLVVKRTSNSDLHPDFSEELSKTPKGGKYPRGSLPVNNAESQYELIN